MKIGIDTHMHTLASDHAYCTLIEMLDYAKEINLEGIVVTDHGPAIVDSAHMWHFSELYRWPRKYKGVYLIKGAEASITDFDGSIDINLQYALDVIEFLIASWHTHVLKPKSKEENTKAYLNLIEKNNIDVLGHIYDPNIELDYDAIFKKAKEYGVGMELNNFRLNRFLKKDINRFNEYVDVIKCALKYDLPIFISSDAHICFELGDYDAAFLAAKKAGATKENIVNTSYEKILKSG